MSLQVVESCPHKLTFSVAPRPRKYAVQKELHFPEQLQNGRKAFWCGLTECRSAPQSSKEPRSEPE